MKKKSRSEATQREKEIMLADMSSLNLIEREWLDTMQNKIVKRQCEN
jgi:hypothetical protein